MVIEFIRLHPAPRHNRVGCADSDGFAEPRADCVYIILLKERICNDVEHITAVIIPVIHSESERGIFNLVCQPAVTFQNIGNSVPVPFFHRPELNTKRIGACSGIRNVKYVTNFRITSRIVKQCDSGRTALHIPSHALVPRLKIRAGGRVGTLGKNQELFVVRIFVQSRRRYQKCLPVFSTVSEHPFSFSSQRAYRLMLFVVHAPLSARSRASLRSSSL